MEGTIRLQIETTMCEHHGEIINLTGFKEHGGLLFPLCLGGGLSFGYCSHLLTQKDMDDLVKALQRAQQEVQSLARCKPAGAAN